MEERDGSWQGSASVSAPQEAATRAGPPAGSGHRGAGNSCLPISSVPLGAQRDSARLGSVLLGGSMAPPGSLGSPSTQVSLNPVEAGQPSPPPPCLPALLPSPPPAPPPLPACSLCVFAAGSSATTISLTLKMTSTRSPVTVEPSTAGSG